jgi:hypothetical protein
MSSSPRSNVLSERDLNIPQSPEKNKKTLKDDIQQQDGPKSLEYHRQALEARLKESKLVDTSTTTTNEKTMSQSRIDQENMADAASFSSSYVTTSHSSTSTTTAIITESGPIDRQAYTIRSLSRNQTYISPSDNIMSPATAKLAAFKNRHVKRYVFVAVFGLC